MAQEESQSHQDLARQEDSPAANNKIISVSGQHVDISDLPEEAQQQLKIRSAEKMIDNQDRATKIAMDVRGLDAKLRTMGETGAEMANNGVSFTATNTQDNELGRTEVMVGNSEAAQRGKFTRSQVGSAGGMSTQAVTLIVIGIIAVTIIAVALFAG
jgi:hypothetical protein